MNLGWDKDLEATAELGMCNSKLQKKITHFWNPGVFEDKVERCEYSPKV